MFNIEQLDVLAQRKQLLLAKCAIQRAELAVDLSKIRYYMMWIDRGTAIAKTFSRLNAVTTGAMITAISAFLLRGRSSISNFISTTVDYVQRFSAGWKIVKNISSIASNFFSRPSNP